MEEKSQYRKALGTFATGVTIITTSNGDTFYGFTANSFTSVSLDPALVLFCVKDSSNFLEQMNQSQAFGINILSSEQQDISNKFANPALLNTERFKDVVIKESPLGSPMINSGCLAYLDCAVHSTTKVGDHILVMGEVKNFEQLHDGLPLLYYGGGYRSLEKK